MNASGKRIETDFLAEVFFDVAKWYFVTQIVLTYCEKKNLLVIELEVSKNASDERIEIF